MFNKRPTRWMAAAALVIGTLTACHDSQGPTEMEFDSTSSDPVNVSPYKTHYTLSSAAAYVDATGASLATMESEDFGDVVTAIIGQRGGTLRAGDHTLVIPPYAVDEDTWFRMEVVSGANVLVDLSAREVEDREPVYEFDKTLTLTLSYKDLLSNTEGINLRNVYLYLDSPRYMIPLVSIVDEQNKTITSPISHFSLYGMAIE